MRAIVTNEIVMVNNTDCSKMSRIEAWNFMKKLNDGTATLAICQKVTAEDNSKTSYCQKRKRKPRTDD